jgi:hypothetical protein
LLKKTHGNANRKFMSPIPQLRNSGFKKFD